MNRLFSDNPKHLPQMDALVKAGVWMKGNERIERGSFEIYKSNVCHRVKELGDIEFIIDTLEQDDIRLYYQRGWYRECLYLLAMLDYLSRVNDVPVCTEYDDLRCCKLQDPLFSSGILTATLVSGSDAPKAKALQEAIPEFLKYNIVEGEVRNVV